MHVLDIIQYIILSFNEQSKFYSTDNYAVIEFYVEKGSLEKNLYQFQSPHQVCNRDGTRVENTAKI